LTFEPDLDMAKVNQRAKYLGQRIFRSKVIVGYINRQTDTVTAHNDEKKQSSFVALGGVD